MEKQSDHFMYRKFLQWVLRFFAQKFEKFQPACPYSDANSSDSSDGVDLPVLVELLRTAGFSLKYSDQSDVTGISEGTSCKVIVVCARSGTRAVLEANVECCCPPENERELLFRPDESTCQTPCFGIRLPVPATSPSNVPPTLIRQNTWSRDDTLKPAVKDLRRRSAPPVHGSGTFQSVTGDDFNVIAAKEMIHEALALLNGGKESVTQDYRNRASSEALLVPSEPVHRPSLSRASSVSSGLASSKSTSSLKSSLSSTSDSVGTPKFLKDGTATRRTTSLAVRPRTDSIRNSPNVASRYSSIRPSGRGLQSNTAVTKMTTSRSGFARKLIGTDKEMKTSSEKTASGKL